MITPELFKIRNHRTPWVLLASYCAIMLIAPAWLLIRPPSDPTVYLASVTGVFAVVGVLLSAVFGGWLVGHEYRQGTLRRVLSIDARRQRLLAVKAAVGVVVLIVGLAIVAGIGTVGSMVAAWGNGDTLIFDGFARELAGAAFPILVTGVIAFVLSVIVRSDAYAMIGALAVMIILGPLLGLIPTVGKYTPFAATGTIADAISAAGTAQSVMPAVLALAATIGTVTAIAGFLFNHRDV